MKIILPPNIFARLLAAQLPEEIKSSITFSPSSVLSKELEKDPEAVALVPALDIIAHKELFISSKSGLSFESLLCNSYMYYSPDQHDIKDVYLFGDISSQEVILSKILFKELYDAAIELHLGTDANTANKNLIIAGDTNFAGNQFARGISFADEMVENLNLPYVNYVFASGTKENLEELHSIVSGAGEKIYNDVENYNFGDELSEVSKDYIKTNISSVIIDFDQQDVEGVEQLIRMPYFYGIIENMIEIKWA